MLALLFLLLIEGAPVHTSRQDPTLPQDACGALLAEAIDRLGPLSGPRGDRLSRELVRAVVDFRFTRRQQALAKLDVVGAMVDGVLADRRPDDRRAAMSAISALSKCFASSQPPASATSTVKTYKMNTAAPDGRGPTAGAGVYVKVEGVAAGRTKEDGTLTLQVPSGPIRVEALVPSTASGEASIDLRGGGTGSISIVLDDRKEVEEDADVVIVEAADDVVSRRATSFTMKLMRDGAVVPITEISHIDLLDCNFNSDQNLDSLFRLESNAIVAKRPSELFAALGSRPEVVMVVHAYDSRSEFSYAAMITFRLAVR